MVSNYNRKTKRQSWPESDNIKTISAIKQKDMGWLKASRQFNVPQSTLRRRCQEKNKIAKDIQKGLGRPSTFLLLLKNKQSITYYQK